MEPNFALCLDDNFSFDAQMLASWRNPIKVEADFVHRAKMLKVEGTESQDERGMGQPPLKKQRIAYKASPRVLFTGFTEAEKQDLQEKVQVNANKYKKFSQSETRANV